MPLPWKKPKVTRISRLVADIQSPAKCGGSLVVETGFPTSLIDLFVKNRDRLRKKKKKTNPREISNNRTVSSPSPSSPKSSSSSALTFIDANALTGLEDYGAEAVASDVGDDSLFDEYADTVNRLNVGGGFMVVLRIFVVLILALCSVKLVVGVTVSAFGLLFFEFVGKRVYCYLKFEHCFDIDTQTIFKSLVSKTTPPINSYFCFSVSNLDTNSSSTNMEIMESAIERDLCLEEHIDRTCYNSEVLSDRRRWGCSEKNSHRRSIEIFGDTEYSGKILLKEEFEGKGDSVEVLLDIHRNRTANTKSKFLKKFVPKKLLDAKNKKISKSKEPESRNESSNLQGDNTRRSEEQEAQKDKSHRSMEQEAQEDKHKLVELDTKLSRGEKVNDDEISMGIVGRAGVRENVGTERKGNLRYIIILLVILAGLVGGRLLAILLTIVLCFGLKLVHIKGNL